MKNDAETSHETQATITKWRDETFGQRKSNMQHALRAQKEMVELLEELATDDASPKAAAEIADIFIVLYGLAAHLGVDIHEEIDRKMAINRARKWNLDGAGSGYHVKEGSTP